jgi:hypothetical protein
MGAAATTLVAGCGGAADTLPRQPVSGTVTFKGAPLKTGMIQFQPAEPGSVTAGGSAVTDGKYAIPVAEGLVPGKYLVTITAAGPAPALPQGTMPGDVPAAPKEPIPAKYNAKSTLTAQVTKEGPNDFKFDLEEK